MQDKSKIWEKLGRHEHIWYDRVPIFSDSIIDQFLMHWPYTMQCMHVTSFLWHFRIWHLTSLYRILQTLFLTLRWVIGKSLCESETLSSKRKKLLFCETWRNLETLVVIQQLLKLSLEFQALCASSTWWWGAAGVKAQAWD